MVNQWVTPRGDQWAVFAEGSEKDTRLFGSKSEAMEFAKGVARNQSVDVIIQDENGRIVTRENFSQGGSGSHSGHSQNN
ncbi:MAG: DUF2188 domain-containing protein [Clostridia bacterium]|nr:DUF2188 domain-containing protein [Clostridia bacterium]